MIVLTTDDTKVISIISGIACGGIASVIVAWIIDCYTCNTENKRSTTVDDMKAAENLMGLATFCRTCKAADICARNW